MTASERRGKRLYLILATLTVLVKLGSVFLDLLGHAAGFDKCFALILVLSVPFLWRGAVWLRRLVGVTYVLSGALSLIHCGRSLVDFDVLGTSAVFEGILGLVDVLAGLAFLFLPDLNAFFRYQREGMPNGTPDRSTGFAERRSFPRVVAGGGWGLALGCGGGVLLAAQWVRSMGFSLSLVEVAAGFLVGVGAGALVGLVAGLAVGAARSEAGMTTLRLAVTRGLVAAGACVITAVVLAAIWGGLFGKASANFPANPGWPRAALSAVLWAVFGGPMLAAAGFVLGVAVALLVLVNNPGKPNAPVDWADETSIHG